MDDISGTWKIGPDSGRVLIKTGRAGLAAKAGHDLTLEITQWSAEVTIPPVGSPAGHTAGPLAGEPANLAAARVTAELDLGSLTVREGTGGAKPLSDKDRRDIEATARRILGADTARFESAKATPEGDAGDAGVVEGTLTLHGATRRLRLSVTRSGPARYRVVSIVRQTEFGITPYSGFFGTLKLQDDIEVVAEADLSQGVRG